MDPKKIVGANLRRFRDTAGMSQERVAELAGVHRTYIGSVERGERNISLENLCKLASALGRAPSELLAGLGPKPLKKTNGGSRRQTRT